MLCSIFVLTTNLLQKAESTELDASTIYKKERLYGSSLPKMWKADVNF